MTELTRKSRVEPYCIYQLASGCCSENSKAYWTRDGWTTHPKDPFKGSYHCIFLNPVLDCLRCKTIRVVCKCGCIFEHTVHHHTRIPVEDDVKFKCPRCDQGYIIDHHSFWSDVEQGFYENGVDSHILLDALTP